MYRIILLSIFRKIVKKIEELKQKGREAEEMEREETALLLEAAEEIEPKDVDSINSQNTPPVTPDKNNC